MDSHGFLELFCYVAVVAAAAMPLGIFMGKVLLGEKTWLTAVTGIFEKSCYRLSGIDPQAPMSWGRYATALLVFNTIGMFVLLLLQLMQSQLPLNPQGFPNVPWWLAFNTAISFVTNTNWQAYSGEATMSYLTQMLGLGVQNFLSAATGIAVMAALARGLSKKATSDIGNFWADLTRTTIYILLPLSVVVALILVSQGVIQNFSPYIQVSTLDGGTSQNLPMGPAASQIAIKQLGSNGGGFFGVNSAHPFENPNPVSNFLEMLLLLLLPAAMPFAFGRLVGNKKHGLAIFAAMMCLFLAGLGISLWAESLGNPALGSHQLLEGKETRFSVASSILWSAATTASSNGSVNGMLSSLNPLSGGIALVNIMLGEVVFGGVGSGLYGMVLFAILAVFIAGLMVGRSPEYLGKKIEAREIKLASIGVLAPSIIILSFAAIACITDAGLSSLANKGPHGLSEILYAFASAAGNNGSAFAGLNANTPFYNILLAVAMVIGRYVVIIPILAIAGGLACKKDIPPSPGTFPTEGLLFIFLLIATVIIVGALTFFPALSLGPVAEHFLMLSSRTF